MTDKTDNTENNSAPKPVAARRSITLTMPEFKRPSAPRFTRAGRLRSGLLALAFLLTAVLGGVGGGYLEVQRETAGFGDGGTLAAQKKVVTSQSLLISQIAKSVGPSVVSVNVTLTNPNAAPTGFDSLFDVSPPSGPQTSLAAGTGIILSAKSGIVITNRHVVPAGTSSVSVTLSDGTELKDVSVIGRTQPSDPLDIAFLKINNTKGHTLTPAALGDSSRVQVGDDVVAIGNALGQFQNTVTSGIISGFGRSVQASSGNGNGMFNAASDTENLDNLFQTDAAINEGNSGGPLVNLNGQVIGINTAIAGNAQNIGFAIPINDVKGLIKQVLKNGKVVRPYLGVRYIPVTADIAKQYNLKTTSGAFIIPSASPTDPPSVLPGSPADTAGLKEGDVITKVANKPVNEMHSLTSLLGSYSPGDKIVLTVQRGDTTVPITVTLGATPSS